MEASADYTAVTRAEDSNVFFEWSLSLDEPDTFFLLEAVRDAEAGVVHVAGQPVQDFFRWAPDWVTAKPQIVYSKQPDLTGWGPMGETSHAGSSPTRPASTARTPAEVPGPHPRPA